MKKPSAKPRMLVIGKTPAMHDRSGSDKRLVEILRAFAPAIEIDFVATNHAMQNLEEKINKTDAYYAIRDGNFRRERFRFLDSGYFDDLRRIGVNPLNEDAPRPLTLRPTNDYDLREYLEGKTYDLVWVQYFYLADRYLSEIRQFQPWAKVYVDSVDLHYLRLERQAHHLAHNVKYVVNVKQQKEEPGPGYEAKVAEHWAYAAQVKKDELRTYKRADLVIASSPDDAEKLGEALPAEKILLLPNIGPEIRENVPGWLSRRGIAFTGNFDHHPNVTAALYLKHEVAPLLNETLHAPLRLLGNNPLYLIKTMQKFGAFAKQIKVSGYQPDLLPTLDRARVSVAPLFFDSGQNNKILEAAASGLPVVTTPLGAFLNGLTHELNCLVAENPAEFAGAIDRLSREEELWRKIQGGGYAYARERAFSRLAPELLRAFQGTFSLEKIRAHQIPVKRPKAKKVSLPPARFKPETKPDVTVILVTFNQWQVTELCLRSLAHAQQIGRNADLDSSAARARRGEGRSPRSKARSAGLRMEVLLVDNASSDGTPALASKIPGLRVIKNKKNLGFAAGNNVGIKAARGKDVVLLNNDTVVAPGWLETLQRHALTIPDLGLLGPATNTEPAQSIPGAAYNSLEDFFAYNRQLAEKQSGAWDVITKVSGLCFYLPRATIEKVGLLDEGFGIGYFEDDDYCMRVNDAGLKLVCAKDVYVHHFGNMSFEGNSMNRIKILEKGMSNFIFKWGKRAMAYLDLNHRNTELQFADPKQKSSF